jgi:hypothetical protein
MGVIRWEDYSEFGDGIWGYLGTEHACTIKAAKVGKLECRSLEIEYAFPGKHASDFRGTKIPTFGEDDAKNIAEQLLQDWMDDVGLIAKDGAAA